MSDQTFDTNPPADRTENPSLFAIEASERIRAYVARFPNMKTVGPEVAHDLRDANDNPYALPLVDILAVVDDLELASMAFEAQSNNERRARKERDAALARVEDLERQLAKVQADYDELIAIIHDRPIKITVGGAEEPTEEPTTAPDSEMDPFEAADDIDRRWGS